MTRERPSPRPDQDQLPDPDVRVEHPSKGRFYAGLAALTVVILFGTLALMAILPILVPGWLSASIISGSMEPVIRAGDVVVASDHDGIGLGPGTVIVFDDPVSDGLLTHRIVNVTPDGAYITQGDANRGADSTPVASSQIRAVGRILVPFVALPRAWIAQGNWLALGAAITVMGLAIRYSAYAVLDVHNPWRIEEEDVDMTIRPEPLPDVAPQPVAVSPAWRDIATGDLRDLPGDEPAEERSVEEAG
jgi:signal peptidase